jgi:hypothetical protein
LGVQESETQADWDVSAILSDVRPPDDGEEGSEARAEEPEEEDAPKTTDHPALPEAVKKPGAWRVNEELFSDKALASPEGVKAARDHLREGKRELHGMWLNTSQRKERFERVKGAVLEEKRLYTALNNQIAADVQALFTGDANTVVGTLGRIARRDPVKLLEELNLNIASNGKPREASPEVRALQSRLDQLVNHLQTRDQQAQTQQQARFVEHRAQQMVQQVAQAPEHYPRLAQLASGNPQATAEAIKEAKFAYFQQHQVPLDDAQTYATIEAELESLGFQATPRNGAGGQAPSVSQSANPARVAHRPPISPSPSQSTQIAHVREMTDDERVAELAADPRELEKLFGLDLSHLTR